MQVWNVLHGARWKYRTQKSRQKAPFGHRRTNFSCYIFETKARIDNRKKLVKQQYVLQMTPRCGELRPTRGWDRSGSLGHHYEFQRLSRLDRVTARQSSSERQPNSAALNRWHHLCSAGRPSRWALAHILVDCLIGKTNGILFLNTVSLQHLMVYFSVTMALSLFSCFIANS